MSFDVSDFLPYYPDTSDSDFYQSIYDKKEFNELSLEKREKIPQFRGELTKNQMFISRLMSSYTPYNSQLLFHTMGTGKSCAAIGAIENLRRETNFFKKAAIFAPSDNILQNFKYQLVFKCTAGQYDVKEFNTPLEQIRRINKEVYKYYEFHSYETFAKHIQKLKDSVIAEKYSNYIFVLDEVHNLRTDDSKDADQLVYYQFHRLLHITKNCKTLLLSGTPMVNSASEFGNVMNLLLPLNNQFVIGKEFMNKYFDKDAINTKNIQDFKDKIKGYVSFLKETESDVVVKYHGTKSNVFTIEELPIEPEQLVGYTRAIGKDTDEKENVGIFSNSRQASLFVFPDGSYGKDGFSKYVAVKKGMVKNSSSTYSLTSKFASELKGKTDDETLDNIAKYGKKYAFAIRKILESTGICFVYSDLVSGSGIILFSCLLQLFSFSRANSRSLSDKKRRYGLLTTGSDIKSIIDTSNDPLNMNGDYIKVLIGSKIISEGYTFKNVKEVLVLSPFFNYAPLEQAIYRTLRIGSQDDPNAIVNIYLCALKTPSGTMSIDMHMYKIAEDKDYKIKLLTRLIMTCATDCQLNFKRNHIDSKDDSRECEYQSCDYVCEGITEPSTIDYSTYDLYYANVQSSVVRLIGDILRKNIKIFGKDLITTLESFSVNSLVYTPILERLTDSSIILTEFTYGEFLNVFFKKLMYSIETIFRLNFSVSYFFIKNYLFENKYAYTDHEILSALNYTIDSNTQLINKYGLFSYLRENNNTYFLVSDLEAVSLYENYYAKFVDIDASISNNIELFVQTQASTVIDNIFDGSGKLEVNLELLNPFVIEKLIESCIEAFENDSKTNEETRDSLLAYFNDYIIKPDSSVWLSLFLKPKGIIRIFKDSEWSNATEEDLEMVNEIISETKENLTTNDYGYYGTYSDNSFCIVKNENEKSDTRKIRTGKVCKSWKMSELLEILITLKIEASSKSNDSLQTIKDYIDDKYPQTKNVSESQYRSLYYWSHKSVKDICNVINSKLSELNLLVRDDTCGTNKKERKEKEAKKVDYTFLTINPVLPSSKKELAKITKKIEIPNNLLIVPNKILCVKIGTIIHVVIVYNENTILYLYAKKDNSEHVKAGLAFLGRVFYVSIPTQNVDIYKLYGFKVYSVSGNKTVMLYSNEK